MTNNIYYDLKYDKDVKQFQYLPYLYNINRNYIDEFNKIILKNMKMALLKKKI